MTAKTLRAAIYLGIFAVITLALTYVLAATITNGSVGSTQSYSARFLDATGLLRGDDVRVAGVRVGQVHGVKIVDHHYALVTFGLEKSIPLHVSSTVRIRYRNLVGQRYVEVDDGPGSDALLPKGQVIDLSHTQSALDLTVLFNGFKPLFQALSPAQVNSMAYEIIRTLQGEGGTIDGLLASTASLSSTIADRDAAVGAIVNNLDTVLATVDARDANLGNLVSELQRLVTGLAGDRDAIAASLGNVDRLAVSTTTLLASIRPALPTDLDQLSALANSLATTTSTVNGTTVNTLDEFIKRFPSKLNAITRTATYGSWFNFYLCDADVAMSATGPPIPVHEHNTGNPAVCGTGQ